MQGAAAGEIVSESKRRSVHGVAHEGVIEREVGYQHAQRKDKSHGVGAQMFFAGQAFGDQGIEQSHANAAQQAQRDALLGDLAAA